MGTLYNAPSLKHKEDHTVLPEEIHVDESKNGRFEAHPFARIINRAIDMLVNGQIAPVGVRKALDKEGKPELVFGYLRTLAGQYINREILPKGGIEVNGSLLPVTEPFRLWISRVDGDDLASLQKNAIENLSVTGTTVMDMVTNQARFLKLNMSEEDIAKMYNMPVEMVRKNRQLLSLKREYQSMIHRGVLSAESGFILLTHSEEQQAEIVENAKKLAEEKGVVYERSEQEFRTHIPSAPNHPAFNKLANKIEVGTEVKVSEVASVVAADGSVLTPATEEPKIKTSAIRKASRQKKQEEGKKGPPLTFSDFKALVASVNVEGEDPVIREWAAKTALVIKGDITGKQWTNALYKVRDDMIARLPRPKAVKITTTEEE